jgi:hypothetical protein
MCPYCFAEFRLSYWPWGIFLWPLAESDENGSAVTPFYHFIIFSKRKIYHKKKEKERKKTAFDLKSIFLIFLKSIFLIFFSSLIFAAN